MSISENGFQVVGTGGKYQALITYIDHDEKRFSRNCDLGSVEKITVDSGEREIVNWGKSNNIPQERENLIRENNIVGELIKTKRNYLVGSRPILYREESVAGEIKKEMIKMPKEINQFLKQNKIMKMLLAQAGDLYMNDNFFTEFVRKKRSDKIISIKNHRAKHMRAVKQDSRGEIPGYVWKGSWGNSTEANNISTKGIYSPAYSQGISEKRFIYHTGDGLLNNGYYNIPTWWGGRKWIQLANCIPQFHLANMQHGFTIRYHIRIPKNYFLQIKPGATEVERKNAIGQANEREQQFINEINDFFAGITNAGRAVITKFDPKVVLGNKFPGIEIEPIKTDIKDEALLKLFDKSNSAQISGQGIPPSLANIETTGKLSSGSEIRNALSAYLISHAVEREILFEPLEIVREINEWDKLPGMDADVMFGFKDMIITKTDDNKAGKEEQL